MNDNILDTPEETEKHTGPRICPVCGYQFPYWEFVRKYIVSYGLSRFMCRNCREVLKCDYIKIQIVWNIGTLIFGVLFWLALSYLNLGAFNFIFLILYLVFVFMTFYYLKFEKHE